MENNDIHPFIKGINIDLSPQNSENVKLYTKWVNDPDVRQYGRNETPVTVEDQKKFIEPQDVRFKEKFYFDIWHRKDKKIIGFIGFEEIDYISRKGIIGFIVGEKDYWGQNICTEAVELITEYGFNELNLHKMVALTFSPNKGSQRVLEKNNYTLESVLKDDEYVDGLYVDTLIYRILKDDWLALRKK